MTGAVNIGYMFGYLNIIANKVIRHTIDNRIFVCEWSNGVLVEKGPEN
jgi:hypothetical protein